MRPAKESPSAWRLLTPICRVSTDGPSPRVLREDSRHADCPIIVLVSASHVGIPAEYRQLAAVQFLTKPAKYAELTDAIAVAMGVRNPTGRR